MFNLTAVVVDTDAARRARCSDAARASGAFARVVALVSVRDLLARVAEGEIYGVAFLGSGFSPQVLSETVAALKEVDEDTACVVAMGAHEVGAQNIAVGVMKGMDGFLCEPFSVDSLSGIAQLALELRRQNQEKRSLAAIKILIGEFQRLLDDAATGLYRSTSAAGSLRKLREVALSIQQLPEHAQELYFELLPELFEDCKVPVERTLGGGNSAQPAKRKGARRQVARWEERAGGVKFSVKDN